MHKPRQQQQQQDTGNFEGTLALVHSVVGVLVGTLVLIFELPNLRFWEWEHTYLKSPTSNVQAILFSCSAIYFLLDLHHLFHKERNVVQCALIMHHIVCVVGLLSPVYYGCDGPIVLVGYILGMHLICHLKQTLHQRCPIIFFSFKGEISNPPRLLAQFAFHSTKNRKVAQPSVPTPVHFFSLLAIEKNYLLPITDWAIDREVGAAIFCLSLS